MANTPLDRYIETIAARLKTLPAAQRDEEMREIRQHLDALVAGHRAAGLSEDEAVKVAIRQFGHAEQVGRELQQSQQPQRLRALLPALLIYLISVGLILAFFVSANDKPTDFPYDLADKIVLACILPAGILVHTVLTHFRTRARQRGV
jgi:hypothetical protein